MPRRRLGALVLRAHLLHLLPVALTIQIRVVAVHVSHLLSVGLDGLVPKSSPGKEATTRGYAKTARLIPGPLFKVCSSP